MFDEFMGWVLIALGTLHSGRALAWLTVGRPKYRIARPATRYHVWSGFRASLLLITIGVFMVSRGAKNHAVALLAIVIAITILILSLALWIRARMRRKSGGPTVTPS